MEVKGVAIKWLPTYVKKKFGKDGLNKWLETISAEAYAVYSIPVETNEWYPIKTVLIEPMANIAQLFFDWDLQAAAWDSGRYSAEITLSGISRFMAKMSSLDTFIDKLSDVFSEYYRPSAIEVVEKSDTMGVVRVTEFPEMEKTNEYRLGGLMERALEIIGCKNVNVEITRSMAATDPYTEYKVTWDPK